MGVMQTTPQEAQMDTVAATAAITGLSPASTGVSIAASADYDGGIGRVRGPAHF